jgi:hypothetical protein
MELLRVVSIVFLWLSSFCGFVIVLDIFKGHRQAMPIMNWVWPITGLWAGPLGLWAYFRLGRSSGAQTSTTPKTNKKYGEPSWQQIAVGDLHCAAGCTIGDFAGEWIVFLTLAGRVLWSDYLLDFVLAYAAGIVFQYFAIAPMKHLHGWRGILAAIKADSVSLIAFEVGMFAWMAFTHVIFTKPLAPTEPVYWFMMQIAMGIGFITAYPANLWLIDTGLKERM